MMSDRKALFFDVDGTLVSESKNEVPESSIRALKRAMEKGHLVEYGPKEAVVRHPQSDYTRKLLDSVMEVR